MIKNKFCKVCGAKLDNNAWYCPPCRKKTLAEKQRLSYEKTRRTKEDCTNRRLARLKAMLDGVDLTPYLPKNQEDAGEK